MLTASSFSARDKLFNVLFADGEAEGREWSLPQVTPQMVASRDFSLPPAPSLGVRALKYFPFIRCHLGKFHDLPHLPPRPRLLRCVHLGVWNVCAPGGGRAREDGSRCYQGLEFISVAGGCLLMAWARQWEFSPLWL